ncbi:MAG: DNA-binding response regulator, partial [Ilumatobacteraceae bacterium]
MADGTTRVVLGEDHALLREGLATVLRTAADIDLIGVAEDLPGLEALIVAHAPDVVVTDIRMP